ncbi:MAG: MBL fold metallo-hydrolase [Candidatus Rifleibacteriota bacterium]
MELLRLSDRVRLIPGPVNIGVILLESSRVALIDSGLDPRHASQIFELLSDYRFKIDRIFNTHAHADHIGGNNFFQQKTGCRILASTLEAPMIRQPLIQAAVLFSGAPIPDLANRFIVADQSQVEIFADKEFFIDDLNIQLLDLPGHSVNQKGFIIDGIAFLADCLFPESFFKKQRLPFVYDPMAQIETLERLRSLSAGTYVGGHFLPMHEIKTLLETNLAVINSSLDYLLDSLKIPQPQDRIIKNFLDHFGIKKTNWEYFLYRATVNGYLSSLYKQKKVRYRVLDSLLMWYAV